MIGRERELEHIRKLYHQESFEFLVMYGRRRVGKTTLLQEFAKEADVIFFPAREKNNSLNLQDFSKAIQLFFSNEYINAFQSWEDAFLFIGNHITKRTAVIIDEFPYIIEEDASIKSILQHVIDHNWKNKNIFLILCGSSINMMETEVMGAKSPLHGRLTSSMEVKPFDYLESSLFLPQYSNEDKLISYGILGGIPRYLEAFDDRYSIRDNITSKIIRNDSYLYEEPDNLLTAELRDTNIYNSILTAISDGRNRITDIADYVHEERTKVAKYLSKLQTLRIVEKKVPCGEPVNSRKSIYVISDQYFRFWYRYSFTNNVYYEILGPEGTTDEIMQDLSTYMGTAFEEICKQYFILLAKSRKLPFIPYYIGRWWGNNPVIRAQDDVDLLCMNKDKTKGIFVECKFTNKPMPYEEYEDLMTASLAFPDMKEKYFYFVSKSGFTKPVQLQAEKDGASLLTIDDLFHI